MAVYVNRPDDFYFGENTPPNPLAGLERSSTGEWVINGAHGAGASGNGGAPSSIPGLDNLPELGRAGPNITESLMGSGGFPEAGGGMWDKVMSLFGKKGLDPNLLLGLGMSMFGGGDEGQERTSFRGAGAADPVDSLNYVLQAIQRIGAGLETRPAPSLRSSVVPGGPAPISLPNIPFQIGGGMGMDPALRDPSLLQGQGLPTQWQPFQGAAQNQWGAAGFDVSGDRPMARAAQGGASGEKASTAGVRRRRPNGAA